MMSVSSRNNARDEVELRVLVGYLVGHCETWYLFAEGGMYDPL